ncbi:hypothetical protein BT69DRAFT_1357057 [Atractiella rhizophila]|nr:hypothetical protein BT69DRAFT_1357057 [Atractiella rhizophila]
MAFSALFATSRVASSRVALSLGSSSRGFSSCSVRGKDFVQELYLKELKAYKPAVVAKDAHVGQVKQLHIPSAPPKPEIPTSASLSSALAEYEKDVPTASLSEGESQGTYKSDAESFLEEIAAQDGEKEYAAEKASHH